ncbi:MAG: RNA-binding protein, partial [Acidobacteria bacterium]
MKHGPAAIACILLLWAMTPAAPQGVATRNAAPAARSAASGQPFPVSLVDVAERAGLAMVFVCGNEEAKRYIVEANGSGVALVDFDNDGWLDVFLVNGSRLEGFDAGSAPTNRLYRNQRDGTFVDVTRGAGLARSGWGNGVSAGDYDNDSFTDLFVTYWGKNVLYRNRGDGTFEDVTDRAGVSGSVEQWSSGSTFIDYDRDGKLDLFVASYLRFDRAKTPLPGSGPNCDWKGVPVFCGPRGLPFGGAALYRNRGDGTFEDVSERAGIRAVSGYYPFTALAVDLNEDGWTDLYVACDSSPSLFLRNNRDGTFSEIGIETGLAYNEHGIEQAGMGVAAGDLDGDGRLDLVKTNFSGDYPNAFRNLGRGIFEDIVLRAGLAVNPQFVGWGVGLVDLDNDGRLDLFQANGHVYPELERQRRGESYRQPRLVYRGLGGGRFEDVSAAAGPGVAARMSSRGAAFGDFDNDGDVDVLVMNMGTRPSLLRNDNTSGNHWIEVKLEGTKSNRSAIGAVATVEAAGSRQTAAVASQSSYISQNDLRLHFG